MQFSLYTIAAAIASAGLVSAAPSNLETRQNARSFVVKYDPIYDDPSISMNNVACSDGANGLTHSFPTFGKVPNFANGSGGYGVVASADVEGWGSKSCGRCYNINYGNRNVWVIAVDHAGGTFNIGRKVMDYLTDGRAVELGSVKATITDKDCTAAGFIR